MDRNFKNEGMVGVTVRKLLAIVVFSTIVCRPGLVASAAEAPRVVASIQPVHSLVAGVMNGVGQPALLLKGGGSPHTYSLRPSEAEALEQSDVVFWIGEELETFLEKPLQALPKHAEVVALYQAEGITLLPYREGGDWDKHSHEQDHEDHKEHEGDHAHNHAHDHAEGHGGKHAEGHHDADHEGHGHGEYDMHVWLDPANAKAMVARIVEVLSNTDPANAPRYQANGAQLDKRLTELDLTLKRDLAPVKDRAYIVFHDAYQYFEEGYGLTPAGSITVSPDRKPSAQKLFEIRKKILDTGADCVFSEPQFEPAVVQTIIEGTDARTGVLDPLGAELAPGPQAYFSVMRNLSSSLTDCLKTGN